MDVEEQPFCSAAHRHCTETSLHCAAAVLKPPPNSHGVKHHHQGEKGEKAIPVPIFGRGSCSSDLASWVAWQTANPHHQASKISGISNPGEGLTWNSIWPQSWNGAGTALTADPSSFPHDHAKGGGRLRQLLAQPVGSCRRFQDTQINTVRCDDVCRDLCTTIVLERWGSTQEEKPQEVVKCTSCPRQDTELELQRHLESP